MLETPIALTNTFSVGTVATAQIRHCVAANPESGRALPTVNPLVFECNDGFLNDIQKLAVAETHYQQALENAHADFAQGAVGAGRGMSSFGLKGGIGSASRRVPAPGGGTHTVGALVLANYGRLPQLVLAGHAVGERLAALTAPPGPAAPAEAEKGSII
ncbi:MAG TPA: P1 family peptidase, partial [Ktedonobacteraceae bacterium]